MRKHIVISAIFWSGLLQAATPSKLNPFKEGERVVYTRIVEAYRAGKLPAVVHQLGVLERNYPTSVHLDNAIYLSAMLHFQNGRIGEAVKNFNRVTDQFPKSGKRSAALFGLAMSCQKLNLKPQSLRVLNSIVREYPGSPEAQRALVQLRIEKTGSLIK